MTQDPELKKRLRTVLERCGFTTEHVADDGLDNAAGYLAAEAWEYFEERMADGIRRLRTVGLK